MFGTSISPSDRNARDVANKQAMDFLYGRSGQTAFSWNLYDERSASAGISSVGGFIPGFTSPFTGKCARSSDCGQGFFCDQGICRPVGTGNTTDCSTGPNENGGIGGSDTCGSSSGTGNLGACGSPGCGSGGPQDCDGGPRCCRFTATSVQCWSGRCGEPADGSCSNYCSGYRASFGGNGAGCSDRNSCSECASCVNRRCIPLTDNIPCHCNPQADDNCGRPGEPLTCCNYKDTCNGRILLPNGQRYCHPTYRTWFPRCYDPTVPCDSPPLTTPCISCESFTSSRSSGDPPFSLPDGCTQTGFIRNEDTGEEKYLYQCCDDDQCKDYPSGSTYIRWSGTIYGAGGFFGTNGTQQRTAVLAINLAAGDTVGWYMGCEGGNPNGNNIGGPWTASAALNASAAKGLCNPPCTASSPFVGANASILRVSSSGQVLSSALSFIGSGVCPGFSGTEDYLLTKVAGSFTFLKNQNDLTGIDWEGKTEGSFGDALSPP